MTTNHPVPTPPPSEPAPSPRPVEELQALCDAATPGPWTMAAPNSAYVKCPECDQGEYVAKGIASQYGEPHHASIADAAFIAAARTAMPSLLARLRAAEETLAAVGALCDQLDAAAMDLDDSLVDAVVRKCVADFRAALAEGASR